MVCRGRLFKVDELLNCIKMECSKLMCSLSIGWSNRKYTKHLFRNWQKNRSRKSKWKIANSNCNIFHRFPVVLLWMKYSFCYCNYVFRCSANGFSCSNRYEYCFFLFSTLCELWARGCEGRQQFIPREMDKVMNRKHTNILYCYLSERHLFHTDPQLGLIWRKPTNRTWNLHKFQLN